MVLKRERVCGQVSLSPPTPPSPLFISPPSSPPPPPPPPLPPPSLPCYYCACHVTVHRSEVLPKRSDVVEINIIQRVKIPPFPTKCAACLRQKSANKKLFRCGKCRAVGYCDEYVSCDFITLRHAPWNGILTVWESFMGDSPIS